MKQPRTIKHLTFLAGASGYNVTARKKDRAQSSEEKKFFPDVIAVPFKGKGERVFEVEAIVTNNTVFKSLVSVLSFLVKHKHSHGYLVVPEKDRVFAEQSWNHLKEVIRGFGKTAQGANPKVNLTVITFQQVKKDLDKHDKWFQGGRVGQPPKCKFLPRPS